MLDEIQGGFGRSGKFFAHQYAGIEADLVTMAKGMGNGFPVAGVLISPEIEAHPGMLGTTFGGNPLACAAALAVLETLEEEHLIGQVAALSQSISQSLSTLPGIKQIKGQGLMLGVEFQFPIKELRKSLLYEHHIFTGSSANPNLLRILPPLTISKEELSLLSHTLNEMLHATVHLN